MNINYHKLIIKKCYLKNEQGNFCRFPNLTDALSSSTISPLMCCVNAEKRSEHFTMKSEAKVSITVRGW